MKKLKLLLTSDIPKTLQQKIVYFILFILVSIFIYLCFKLYSYSTNPLKGWTFSDWLVNYEDGGFKRRGLSGSSIFFIEKITALRISTIILSIQYSIYFYIFYKIIQSFFNKKIDLYFCSMLLLPYVLGFNLVESTCLGRKEITLISIAIFQVMTKDFFLKKYLLIIFLLITILLHEMAYFYLPFFVFFDYLKNKKIDYVFFLTLGVFSTGLMISFFYFGAQINEGESLKILSEKSIVFQKANFFLHDENSTALEHIKTYFLSYSVHLIELFLSLSFMMYYIFKFHPIYFKKVLVFTFISLGFSIPLYYLAIDWFRWNYIFCTLFFLIIYVLLDEKELKKGISINNNQIKSWALIFPIFLFIIVFFHMQNDLIIKFMKDLIS